MGTFFAAFFGFFAFCFMALFFGVFGVIAFVVIAGLIALVAASSHAQALRVARLKAEASARAAEARYQTEKVAWDLAQASSFSVENAQKIVEMAQDIKPKPEKLKVQRADGRKPWYLR